MRGGVSDRIESEKCRLSWVVVKESNHVPEHEHTARQSFSSLKLAVISQEITQSECLGFLGLGNFSYAPVGSL